MESAVAVVAAVGSAAFAIDLGRDAVRRPRPHVIAYAAGMGMFALATIALAVGLLFGWNEAVYKIFYLFGAILNIPYLALGSVYLVAGPRAGRFYLGILLVFTLISALVVLSAAVDEPLASSGVPSGREVFAVDAPRILAVIGSGMGTILLVGSALVSIVRFWRTDRRIVWANTLIVAGVMAAATRGTALGVFGEGGGFAVSLLVAVVLIWTGYRVASGARRGARTTP